ncbi:MAG TPA: hypothetical protein VK171_05300 [Fimbriimonas sp.]|nr:hypothetical protein [Fimbriimonas sp.]
MGEFTLTLDQAVALMEGEELLQSSTMETNEAVSILEGRFWIFERRSNHAVAVAGAKWEFIDIWEPRPDDLRGSTLWRQVQ